MKKTAFSKSGFYIIPEVLNKEQVEELRNAVQQFIETNRTKNYGIRRLLELIPEVRTLMASPPIRTIVESILGTEAFPVRGIFFDKNPKANWGVPWHQDLTIAVGDQAEPGAARSHSDSRFCSLVS